MQNWKKKERGRERKETAFRRIVTGIGERLGNGGSMENRREERKGGELRGKASETTEKLGTRELYSMMEKAHCEARKEEKIRIQGEWSFCCVNNRTRFEVMITVNYPWSKNTRETMWCSLMACKNETNRRRGRGGEKGRKEGGGGADGDNRRWWNEENPWMEYVATARIENKPYSEQRFDVTRTHVHTYTRACIHSRAYAKIHIHMYTHTRACTHIHTLSARARALLRSWLKEARGSRYIILKRDTEYRTVFLYFLILYVHYNWYKDQSWYFPR